MRWSPCILATMVVASLAAVPTASGSTLVDRGASAVSAQGQRARRRAAHVPPGRRDAARAGLRRDQHEPRCTHRLDYSGGWGAKVADWRTFRNACGPYTGPPLQYADGRLHDAGRLALGGPGVDAHQAELRRQARRPRAPRRPLVRAARRARDPRRLVEVPRRARQPLPPPVRPLHVPGPGRLRQALDAAPACRSTTSAATSTSRACDSDYGAGWRRVNAFVSRSPRGQFCFEFGPKVGFGRREAHRPLVGATGTAPASSGPA